MKLFMITIVALLSFSGIVRAQPVPIDFEAPIADFDGKPIMLPGEEGKKETLTLGLAALIAINNQQPAPNAPMSADKKFKDGQLIKKIYHRKVILTADEIVTLKDAIGKQFSPTVVMVAFGMLDPAQGMSTEEAKEKNLKDAGTNKTVKDIETPKK